MLRVDDGIVCHGEKGSWMNREGGKKEDLREGIEEKMMCF